MPVNKRALNQRPHKVLLSESTSEHEPWARASHRWIGLAMILPSLVLLQHVGRGFRVVLSVVAGET